jgi:hypothetical protein
MKKFLDYSNRLEMYGFLINDFNFMLVEEKFDEQNFCNFFIDLLGKNFLIRYVKDRDYLTIEVSPAFTNTKNWIPLSVIKDHFSTSGSISQPEPIVDTDERINNLNNFLKKDLDRISNWFAPDNYKQNYERLLEQLKSSFDRKYPNGRVQ